MTNEEEEEAKYTDKRRGFERVLGLDDAICKALARHYDADHAETSGQRAMFRRCLRHLKDVVEELQGAGLVNRPVDKQKRTIDEKVWEALGEATKQLDGIDRQALLRCLLRRELGLLKGSSQETGQIGRDYRRKLQF